MKNYHLFITARDLVEVNAVLGAAAAKRDKIESRQFVMEYLVIGLIVAGFYLNGAALLIG